MAEWVVGAETRVAPDEPEAVRVCASCVWVACVGTPAGHAIVGCVKAWAECEPGWVNTCAEWVPGWVNTWLVACVTAWFEWAPGWVKAWLPTVAPECAEWDRSGWAAGWVTV